MMMMFSNGRRAAVAATIKGSNRLLVPSSLLSLFSSSSSVSSLKSSSISSILFGDQQQQQQRRLFHSFGQEYWTMTTPSQKSQAAPSHGNLVNPPPRLMHPVHFPDRLLMGPGPSNMTQEIRAALSAPLLGHLHPEFLEIMDDVKAGLQYAFQTENPLTFAVSGTGHAGMECAILNLLEPGETILVLQNGVWGQRAADLGRRLNLDVKLLHVGEGQVISMEDFCEAVEKFKPAVAFLCHGESSTGVVHPLEGFGEVCRNNGALLLVDTVASLGAAPFHADELQVDCVYSASQKVFNCPPGLAPISFNDRALAKIRFRKTRVPSFYFDALEIGNYWGCFTNEARRYHHTAPISLVYALRESLSMVAKEGIENIVARHLTNVHYLHHQLENIGLELFVTNPKHRLPCLTTVKVPKGVDWKEVQSELMRNGIEIAGGLGPTVGKIWRIGTFGANSDMAIIATLMSALKKALGVAEPEHIEQDEMVMEEQQLKTASN